VEPPAAAPPSLQAQPQPQHERVKRQLLACARRLHSVDLLSLLEQHPSAASAGGWLPVPTLLGALARALPGAATAAELRALLAANSQLRGSGARSSCVKLSEFVAMCKLSAAGAAGQQQLWRQGQAVAAAAAHQVTELARQQEQLAGQLAQQQAQQEQLAQQLARQQEEARRRRDQRQRQQRQKGEQERVRAQPPTARRQQTPWRPRGVQPGATASPPAATAPRPEWNEDMKTPVVFSSSVPLAAVERGADGDTSVATPARQRQAAPVGHQTAPSKLAGRQQQQQRRQQQQQQWAQARTPVVAAVPPPGTPMAPLGTAGATAALPGSVRAYAGSDGGPAEQEGSPETAAAAAAAAAGAADATARLQQQQQQQQQQQEQPERCAEEGQHWRQRHEEEAGPAVILRGLDAVAAALQGLAEQDRELRARWCVNPSEGPPGASAFGEVQKQKQKRHEDVEETGRRQWPALSGGSTLDAPTQRLAPCAQARYLTPALVRRIEDGKEAFLRHRAAQEATLRGTGLEQWQLLPLLGDAIAEELLEEQAAELEAMFEDFSKLVVRSV
jgi:hypothetical protein